MAKLKFKSFGNKYLFEHLDRIWSMIAVLKRISDYNPERIYYNLFPLMNYLKTGFLRKIKTYFTP